MKQLVILVEGETEEAFVNDLLKPHLKAFGIEARAHNQHGVAVFSKTKRTIQRYAQMKNTDIITTMLDLYALPPSYPGLLDAVEGETPFQKAERIEATIHEAVECEKFIAYVQLHEFEALLLSDPAKMRAYFFEHDTQIANLETLCTSFTTPELINEHPDTAPSKRIIREIPDYDDLKPIAGPFIAREIGLQTMRAKCPHFHEWLRRLEALGQA